MALDEQTVVAIKSEVAAAEARLSLTLATGIKGLESKLDDARAQLGRTTRAKIEAGGPGALTETRFLCTCAAVAGGFACSVLTWSVMHFMHSTQVVAPAAPAPYIAPAPAPAAKP